MKRPHEIQPLISHAEFSFNKAIAVFGIRTKIGRVD